MPQLVKKRRSGWAVLAAGALIASLFAVGAAPVAALDDDSMPNAPAATSACVGDATEDMDFSDVSEMNTFHGAINCLAYYGVTIGYGDGTFGPENDVTRGQMVLFMERAAAAAGADAEAVVGDFAETGSDPVNRADMALLIARLLVSATDGESPVNVTNAADGTFAVSVGLAPNSVAVTGDDWDYFAEARSSLNRVSDSAVSALYELGVANGTGNGNFSPSDSVSRGQMAAFITRALAHTSARPSGVSIQAAATPGEAIISVRDANFHPLANAPLDIFSARADKVGEAFNEDGSCNTARVTREDGDADGLCAIDALDPITNLSGDHTASIAVNVQAGGTTVWAWTGDSGDKVEDGGEGLASINLTATAPVTADMAKVTTDPDLTAAVARAAFGSTVTVTIQLIGDADANLADAVPPEGGASYEVEILRESDTDIRGDVAPEPVTDDSADSKEIRTLSVDASGKVTFELTAEDPDTTDRNNPVGDGADVPDKIDRVRFTYSVTPATGGIAVDDTNSHTTGGAQTITFSDARGNLTGGSIELTTDFLTRPMSGSASNVVTVKVVDQYGHPIRGHLVRLSSSHAPTGDGPNTSTFPVARRTDSSGSVRIGYTYTGTGSVESLVANTSVTAADTETLTPIANATKDFYWVAPAGPGGLSGVVLAADLERNMIIVTDTTNGPQLVLYDDNDQYAVGATGDEALTSMAAFEEALAKDGEGPGARDDSVAVTSYDPTDSGDVARFVLTVS